MLIFQIGYIEGAASGLLTDLVDEFNNSGKLPDKINVYHPDAPNSTLELNPETFLYLMTAGLVLGHVSLRKVETTNKIGIKYTIPIERDILTYNEWAKKIMDFICQEGRAPTFLRDLYAPVDDGRTMTSEYSKIPFEELFFIYLAIWGYMSRLHEPPFKVVFGYSKTNGLNIYTIPEIPGP